MTTVNPYKYFYYTTTTTTPRPEYTYATVSTTIRQPVTYPPSFNKYSITSTKSPYDFKDFITRTVDRNDQVKKSYTKDYYSYFDKTTTTTTKNPYLEKGYDYYGLSTRSTKSPYEKSDYFARSTTKSPYQDKGIRSLYKIGTYYQHLSKTNDNSIRPDASQQVNIEPARLVYSYRTNMTTGGK